MSKNVAFATDATDTANTTNAATTTEYDYKW